MPPTTQDAHHTNFFLKGLFEQELKNLSPHLQWVSLKQGEVLFGSGDCIQDLYFPSTAMVSIITTIEKGRSVEVALIGSEGLVGVCAAMGADRNWQEAVVLAPGDFLKIKVGAFRVELNRSAALRNKLYDYVLFLLAQVSQNAACNRLHMLEQRLARWLLATHDGIRTNEFHQTHELISHLLGTGRSEVTLAAEVLRNAGLISYSRGNIRVLDRKGLEEAACKCYKIIVAESIRFHRGEKTESASGAAGRQTPSFARGGDYEARKSNAAPDSSRPHDLWRNEFSGRIY